jgi:malto-oligosyltrehalose trehalohydrolase
MSAHQMPFGAELCADGTTRFRLWAPAAAQVRLQLSKSGVDRPMRSEPHGWHELVTAATAGEHYRFVLPDGLVVADPASRCQAADADGPSVVVDPSAYSWRHPGWAGRPWHETVLYELHVGTFTAEGTFTAAAARLPYLADLGITAVELMPLAEFPGSRNWGYDGVLPFAPDRAYGTPDELKALIDAAHGLGLMVFLDVVDNHFGPEGNFLARYAPGFYTKEFHTPWGAAIDFRDPTVRSFYRHNALYWLNEYRFDGLRFDAVHAIVDTSETHFLLELARAVRTGVARPVHLVLENEHNRAAFLRHDPQLGQRLYDAQWNDDLHHAAHALITGEAGGYYADFADAPADRLRRALAEGFVYQGEPSRHQGGKPRGERSADLSPLAFVGFLQNHDQIGNRALGERLTRLAPREAVAACQAVLLLCPHVPLLFMGEEWGASTPFLYFCEFHGALAQAVRDGRRREFAAFFAHAEDVPDPLDDATFAASQLDWSELEQPAHAACLERTRTLLRLRQREIVPRLAGGEVGVIDQSSLGPHGLKIDWRLADRSVLGLQANLGPAPLAGGALPAGPLLFATHAPQPGAIPPWSVAWQLRQGA